ncbi:general odorant-binding protein 57d [Drosophila yakuba]|uniref:Odorant-binding protein 57d n=1 Tax=Drosophila yakuba TaxID=7245 RepID=B4PA55_DROYA|nr:general odorant-binding protein 57d [Drosophila yakuba]EDW91386.2 Odorant-binding protein 57d [Drosophila yakuba]
MISSTSLMSGKMSVRLLLCITFMLRYQFSNSEFYDPCTHANGIDEDEAEAAVGDWPQNLNLTSVNRSHKCYVICILQYYNIVSTSGEITLGKYYDTGVIDEFAVAPKINLCRYKFRKEKDFCERMFAVFNCLRQDLLINS